VKDRPILFGSLAAGLLASACCIGPLVLGAIGLGSLGFAAWMAPARPWFLALTAVLLSIGFYLAYRPVRPSHCEPGEACETPKSRRPQRIMLWSVMLVAAALVTYPSWGARRGRGSAVTIARDSSNAVVALDVSGMTCEACEGEIEHQLRAVPGVVQASVNYEQSRAEIVVGRAFSDPRPLIAAVEKAGYRAATSGRPAGPGEWTSKLSGQWRGRLTVNEEGETTDLIVDLDRVAGRWTGQFDLPSFGVEDYPVEVAFAARTVTLQLSAAQIEFIGELNTAATALAGMAETRGHRDSLVLHRVGGSHFSEEFLRLEALSGDSTRVELLSAHGTELRDQFNRDRGYTRLLMLLSPT
jgi:mercuric ion transport protein